MKKRILPYLLLLVILSVTMSDSYGQAPVKEYGIGFSGFNSFSLQHRWGDGTKFYRVQGNLSGRSSSGESDGRSFDNTNPTNKNSNVINTEVSTPVNLFFGFSFSILKLKSLNDKFGLMYGTNYGVAFATNKTETTTTTTSFNNNMQVGSSTIQVESSSSFTVTPSVGIVLGGYYKINEFFYVYGEVIPNIYYSYNSSSNDNNYGITQGQSLSGTTDSFGLSGISNSGAAITLIYRLAPASN